MGIYSFPEAYLNDLEIGSFVPWPDANSIPAGFMAANGAAISRTDYPEAFARFGTEYGPGDGTTTFNLPNLPLSTLPWNLPRGEVARARNTVDTVQSGAGTRDIDGTSVTYTQIEGRKYRMILSGSVKKDSTKANVVLHISDGSNEDLKEATFFPLEANTTRNFFIIHRELAVSTGSVTRKGRLTVGMDGGTATVEGDIDDSYAEIIVEDIGADVTKSPWSKGCWIVKMTTVQPSLPGQAYEICSSTTRPTGRAGKKIWETDTNREWTYSSGEWVLTGGSVPRVRATKTTIQSIPNAGEGTLVTWPGTDTYDTDSMHDPVTDNERLVAPVDGVYVVSASLAFAPSASGTRAIWFHVNNTGIRHGQVNFGATTVVASQGVVVPLNAGDYVVCYVYQDSGEALNLNNDPINYFSLTYLGPL